MLITTCRLCITLRDQAGFYFLNVSQVSLYIYIWHSVLFPIEVGCRGFPATSLHYFLQNLGMSPKQVKYSTKEKAEAAESCSR